MRLPARKLVLADPPAPWEALGFPVRDGAMTLGALRVEFGDSLELAVEGLRTDRPDGLPIVAAAPPSVAATPSYEDEATLGVLAVDHLVVLTGSLDRTAGALAEAGLDLRRRAQGRVPQAFFNLASTILEVGETDDPARFWGMTVVVEDLDAAVERLGPLLGTPRDAVQPGRRIATLRREAGLGLAVALITPRVRTR